MTKMNLNGWLAIWMCINGLLFENHDLIIVGVVLASVGYAQSEIIKAIKDNR